MSYLSIVLDKLAKFFRGDFFGAPGIFTDIHDNDIKPGIWIVDISDHLTVFAVSPTTAENVKLRKLLPCRT